MPFGAGMEDGQRRAGGEDGEQDEGKDARRALGAGEQRPDAGDQRHADGDPVDVALLEAEMAGRQVAEDLERPGDAQHDQGQDQRRDAPPAAEQKKNPLSGLVRFRHD